jgi:hypothetical protein
MRGQPIDHMKHDQSVSAVAWQYNIVRKEANGPIKSKLNTYSRKIIQVLDLFTVQCERITKRPPGTRSHGVCHHNMITEHKIK